MAAGEATHVILRLIKKNPWYGVTFGLFFASLFGWLAINSAQEAQLYSAGPEVLTLENAFQKSSNDEIYVRLSDVITEGCVNGLVMNKNIFIPIHSKDGQIDVVAFYGSPKKCLNLEKKPIEGTMKRMLHRQQDGLRGVGLNLSPDVRSICTNCGIDNSKLGILVGSILFLLSIAIVPLSFWMHKKS